MVDLFLLSQTQMRRIERYFPLSHGIAQVDDWRIVSAIVFVIKNGLRWRDAPSAYGPHETIYNRFVRWSRLGVFNKIFAELARKGGKPERIMIEQQRIGRRDRADQRMAWPQCTRRTRMPRNRTSRTESRATALYPSRPTCTGRRYWPPRPRREQKRRARTRDEADKEALGAPSCGRSQTSLYNEVRPHRPIGNEPRVPSQENSTFRRSAFDSRSESALLAETLIAVREHLRGKSSMERLRIALAGRRTLALLNSLDRFRHFAQPHTASAVSAILPAVYSTPGIRWIFSLSSIFFLSFTMSMIVCKDWRVMEASG
jgi:putative transposase